MKYIDFLRQLEEEGLVVFSTNDVARLSGSTKDLVKQQLYSWRKKGWIKSLKKGLYEAIYPTKKIIPDLYIANILYEPSYISLETALSYYSLIEEVAMQVVSVTTKPTRVFRNHYGYFQYRSIKENAFVGYHLITEQDKKIKIAEPEKALVDYLYFNLYDKNSLDIDELRLDKTLLETLNVESLRFYARLLYNNKTSIALERIYA